jgi:hypothetical protein
MTKARDLANLISGGFTEADIPNLSASKITSGTFADARLSASSVQQFASTFDDNKIVNDISTLGLRVHTQENLNASNTNSASFDVFQDSSGITNLTNVVRNSNEYINTETSSITNHSEGIHGGNNKNPSQTASGSSSYTGYDGVTRANGQIGEAGGYRAYCLGKLFSSSEDFELIVYVTGDYQGMGFVYGNDMSSLSSIGTFATGGYIGAQNATWSSFSQGTHQGQYHSPLAGDGNSNYKNLYRWSRTSGSFKLQYYGRTTGTLNVDATSIAAVRASTNYVANIGGVQTRNEKMLLLFGDAGSGNSFKIEVLNNGGSSVFNATGSFEGNAITASSTNKMGAVITYQDNAGTNALNTDIVLKLSADNGSNYSTATLTALPDFATGIKMAKVNDLSVTAGTQLKYKLEFANQASGSKEARIRGVSLQY